MTTDDATRVILQNMQEDVHEIKKALTGNGDRPGLIIDVDRLKQKQARQDWLIGSLFTAIIGSIVAFFTNLFDR